MDDCIERKAQALGVEPSRLRELAEADKDGRSGKRRREAGNGILRIHREGV